MATTKMKKTTTATTATKPVEKVVVENNAETETVVEKETKATVKSAKTVKENVEPKVEKKTFTDSDYILCRSVWTGALYVTCQSGVKYKFSNYDAECEINYRDLVTLIRRNSDHVFLPRFIIEDEDFLEEFPHVQRVYGAMYTATDLLDIVNLPESQMKSEIAKLPDATKNTMRNLIATEIAKGRIDSIRKVRVLSEIFDSDFNLMSELFGK